MASSATSQWDTTPSGWNIPIYGLIANLINLNPTLQASSAGATPNGNYCLISAPSPLSPCNNNTCYPEIQGCVRCNALAGEIFTAYDFINNGPIESCTTTSSQCFSTTCTSTCSKVAPTTTCPQGGTSIGWDPTSLVAYNNMLVTDQFPSLPPSAVCEYTITGSSQELGTTYTDLIALGAPAGWLVSMIARYCVYSFLTEWNSSVYGTYTSPFHIQCDFTDTQSMKSFVTSTIYAAGVPQILSSSPSTVPGYANSFVANLAELGQLHMLTYTPAFSTSGPTFGTNAPAGPTFGMLYYDFSPNQGDSHTIGATSEPTAQAIAAALTDLTTEDTNAVTVSFSPVQKIFQYPPTLNDFLTNPYYIFIDINALGSTSGRITYNLNVAESELVTISQARQSTPNGDFYVIGRIFPIIITKLSAVLSFWYAYEFPVMLTSPTYQAVCSRISTDTSQLPQQCYINTCGPGTNFSDQCKSQMIGMCGNTSFIPSTIFPRITSNINAFFMTNASTSCQCYNTRLRPIIGGDADRIPGMCYTKQCDNSIKSAFGLTDSVCAGYCPKVYDWLINGNVGMRQYIDQSVYERLCGANYVPTSTTRFNIPIIVVGMVSAIMISGIVWMIFRSIPKTIITGLILGGIAVFLSMLLNGKSICNPNPLYHNNECQSTLLSNSPIYSRMTQWFKKYNISLPTNLPTVLCPNPIACECIVNSQCTASQTCISGVCVNQ